MNEVYKIINCVCIKGCASTLLSYNALAQGHRFRLLQLQVHHDPRKCLFINRMVSLWNSLPDDVVLVETLDTFKNRLDKHW